MTGRYVVAALRPWNIALFHALTPHLPGQWSLITEPAALTRAALDALAPRYVFFPHWSSRVADDVIDHYDCVCFHMTDVPYGRGGTPLQNLIAAGHRFTRLSALRMVRELDAGPVYMKRTLSLDGRAEEIYQRAATLAYDMMAEIVQSEPVPVPQCGTPTVFPRRRPEQSRLPEAGTAEALFDHIRMLDAPGYPHAFVDHGQWRLSLTHATLTDGEVEARVRISKAGPEEDRKDG